MPRVQIEDGLIRVGEQRVPLMAGEMHYWRVNPACWSAIMSRFRELGLNMVATYVPWEYHELAPGRFDFHGRSEPPRNLVGFLDLLHEQDYWVFIRPGPYIYAEWTNAGVPDRVVALPRLSEEYRREAIVWMRAVAEVLKPYLATNGGRIVLFQPDNEMDLFSHWFEDACGLDGAHPGLFQQFLKETYADVATLNDAWGTRYGRFEDAEATAEACDPYDPYDRVRHKDYWRFQHWATTEGVRWHVEQYRALGIDVPQLANYYPGGDVQNWRELARVVDACGIDWYPRNEFAGDGGAQRRFLDTCRYQRAVSPLPCIAEFECGVWHGFHEHVGALTPNHYRLTAFSAMLAGIQGFNWYMFAGRDNWYYSPVNERGQLRGELAEVFANVHRIAGECDLSQLTKLTQTCVLFEPLQVATDNIVNCNPVLDALYAADIDFEIFDPELLAIEKPLMFYAAADWLSRSAQQRVAEYMEAGGILVVFRDYPRRDSEFRPHNGLGIVPPDRILSRLGKKVELRLGDQRPVAEGAVWNWDRPPGEPLIGRQVIGRQQAVENADAWMRRYIGREWVCGYREPRSRGALVVLGLPPSPALVSAVHNWLSVPIYAQAQTGSVRTALFRRASEYYLFATSLADADLQTRVALSGVDLPSRIQVTDLWSRDSAAMDREQLTVALARRSGDAWRITAV